MELGGHSAAKAGLTSSDAAPRALPPLSTFLNKTLLTELKSDPLWEQGRPFNAQPAKYREVSEQITFAQISRKHFRF